jgi:hypothetical protein
LYLLDDEWLFQQTEILSTEQQEYFIGIVPSIAQKNVFSRKVKLAGGSTGKELHQKVSG